MEYLYLLEVKCELGEARVSPPHPRLELLFKLRNISQPSRKEINIFSSNQNFCNKLSSNLHLKMGDFSKLEDKDEVSFCAFIA